MNPSPFLFYLADVGCNSATFAVLTLWTRSQGSLEVRVPSPIPERSVNDVLYKFDKAAQYIQDWRLFYSWLGRGGWAAFSPEAGGKLIPGWLSPATEYICASVGFDSIRYIEDSIRPEWEARIGAIALMGSPEPDAARWFDQLVDNLVLARRPLF